MKNFLRHARQAWRDWQTRSLTPAAAAWLGGDDDPSPGTLQNGYQQSVWIYACIQAIAEQVALTPFRFSYGQPRGEEIIETGPLVGLFNRPHPCLDRFEFWELYVTHLLLRGRVFIVALDRKTAFCAWMAARAPLGCSCSTPITFSASS
jgi:phage portal protein BeeE